MKREPLEILEAKFQEWLLLTLEQQRQLLAAELAAREPEGPSEFAAIQEMSSQEGDGA